MSVRMLCEVWHPNGWEIWGLHNTDAEDSGLLGCYIVYSVIWCILTFRRNTVPFHHCTSHISTCLMLLASHCVKWTCGKWWQQSQNMMSFLTTFPWINTQSPICLLDPWCKVPCQLMFMHWECYFITLCL